jgi:glyoxylase-like metal-dependent hydrolase (beta-lactamase superfamily II)
VQYSDDKAFVVDIGGEADVLDEFLAERGLSLTAVLLTHGHFDHILGVADTVKKHNCPVYIHQLDSEKLISPLKSLQVFHPESQFKEVERHIPTADEIEIDKNIKIQTIHTPGHTAGSVCYLFKNANALFTGDTLFAYGSIGRTDFPDGNYNDITSSLKKIFSLDKKLKIYPGHGSFELELGDCEVNIF